MEEDDLLWSVAASGAAVLAATVAKKALTRGWIARRGKVPGNPATGETTWNEALAWAVVSGVTVGVVRLLAQRGVAAAFVKAGRTLPTAAAESASA